MPEPGNRIRNPQRIEVGWKKLAKTQQEEGNESIMNERTQSNLNRVQRLAHLKKNDAKKIPIAAKCTKERSRQPTGANKGILCCDTTRSIPTTCSNAR